MSVKRICISCHTTFVGQYTPDSGQCGWCKAQDAHFARGAAVAFGLMGMAEAIRSREVEGSLKDAYERFCKRTAGGYYGLPSVTHVPGTMLPIDKK